MKNANLRVQTTTPAVQPDVVNLFASGNGFLFHQTSGGSQFLVGTLFSGILPNTAIRTGANSAYLLTGTVFGSHQGALFATGLSTPQIWVPITYNGTNYALPAYALA